MLTFRFTGADGHMVATETLTSGMVGKEVKLEFSSDWDNLTKTAVFTAGFVTRDVVGISDVVTIPAEVLAVPMKRLNVGVYGVSEDGKVTPTIRAQGPLIQPGADPSGDEGTDPELPVWAQLDERLTKMEQDGTCNGCADSSQIWSGVWVGDTPPEDTTMLWIDTSDDAHGEDPNSQYYTKEETDRLIDEKLGVIENGAY